MNILVVEPGVLPYEKEIDSLRDMQEIVGGTITASYPFEDMAAIVSNDDSIGLGMPFNRSIESGYGGIFGTFFVCGLGGDDFIAGSMIAGIESRMPELCKAEEQPSKKEKCASR